MQEKLKKKKKKIYQKIERERKNFFFFVRENYAYKYRIEKIMKIL